jgi:acyl-CoA reductase-like NAD-dependent aldehyde dehydrogenase
MWIGGSFASGVGGQAIAVTDPASGEKVGEVPRGLPPDIDAAVGAAVRALPSWRGLTTAQRSAAVHAIAGELGRNKARLAEIVTLESGKPLRDSEAEVDIARKTFEYFADLARRYEDRMVPADDPDQLDWVRLEPYGVTACIVSWNFPLQLLAWKLAPALAGGNTVVALPSPLAPLATLLLAELAGPHLPAGAFNVVTGLGGEAGDALVRHPQVAHVAFTGSVETGRQIAVAAAPQLKKVTLELGGKDPLIVAPDIDLETAVAATAFAALLNAGQCCTSTERVYVPANRTREFAEALTGFVSAYRLGPGLDPASDMGPLISEDAVRKVGRQVEEAVRSGATVLTGGKRPKGLETGHFYCPTVLTGVAPDTTMMTEETFGPVIPVIPYGSFDEAIERANDSEFGLAATLMTRDAALAKQFFEQVQSGTVYINDPLTPNVAAPFGGMKRSGLGRELGAEGFSEFCQPKHVHWDLLGRRKDSWISN